MPIHTTTPQYNPAVSADTPTLVITPITTNTSASANTDEPTNMSPPPQGAVKHAQNGEVFPKTYTNGTVRYNPKKRAFFAERTYHLLAL